VTPPPAPIPGARLLFSLDPSVAYLNHGGFGAVPLAVQRAQLRLRDEMESNPHRFFTTSLFDRIGHARRHISMFLGADPESTAFVPNATAGVNIVLRSLGVKPGDEIITTDHGYGSVAIAVNDLCARTGAKHTVVPIALAATDTEIVAELSKAISDRTRLMIVDQITSATARCMPVTAIAAAARRSGVPLLVDSAHGPGTLPMPIASIGADYWVGNLHKWAFAPRPTAILSVAPHRRSRLIPNVISWSNDAGFPENIEMGGTLDYTAWLAAPTGLYVMRTVGVDRIRTHNAALAAYGQRVVGAALGLLSPADLPQPGAATAAMRLLPLPAGVASTQEAAIHLHNRISSDLHVEVAVTIWRSRGFLRIAAQIYNHPDEYDRLAAGLPKVLRSL
jgi:isopenicillin-N epimerase